MAKPITYCKVDNCTSRVRGHGMCNMHYTRWIKTGSTDPRTLPDKPKTLGKCILCDNDAVAKNYCQKHYKKHILNGPGRPMCSVDDCSRPVNSKGLCALHYGRLRDTGTTDEPVRKTVEERFWEKVDKHSGQFFEGTECWNWTAAIVKGHGFFNVSEGNTVGAYRYSYELVHGPLPTEIHVHHRCQNKACVNPQHLEAHTPTSHYYETMAEVLRQAGWTVIRPV